MELEIGQKLFGLERRLYCFEPIPYVFVVHSVSPKFARIKPFNLNPHKQSTEYTVFRTLVPKESRFYANWRGQHHPAFPSSFDYLWLWDKVCKTHYLQAVLYLKIKHYIHSLNSQLESLTLLDNTTNFDNLQFCLKCHKLLNEFSKNLDNLSHSKSKDLVLSQTELTILEVNSFNEILEDFCV